MAEAFIVAAARTAGGRRGGRLAGWHPVDLAAEVLGATVERSGIDPAAIDDVIMGCVTQAGEQSMQVGRYAVLASKLPPSVPAVSIDRQCGSSQQAVQFAAQAVMSGTQDVVIAAGVESMTRVPMFASMLSETGVHPMTARLRQRWGVEAFSQFDGAEQLAVKYDLSREVLDRFALGSHQKGTAAIRAGAFADEIVPISVTAADGSTSLHTVDEGCRPDASYEAIAALKLMRPGGRVSAGNASQICDGAAALMVVSERALKTHRLKPLARIHQMTVTAGDPVIMLEEPVYATDRALKCAGLSLDDIDLYEVNEAFSSVPLAWLKATGADPDRLNVNGGAIALGHPLGATGAKLMATLVHALRRRKQRYGLQTMCEGGGTANVTILEAL